MKLFGILAAGAVCFLPPISSFAAIILSVPSSTRAIPASATDLVVDVAFITGGTTSPLVGYDVAFKITGPTSDLTITGVSTGASRPGSAVFADNPAFFTNTSTGTTLYGVSDFLVSGTGTITDGSVLVELKLHANAGTTGAFSVDFVTDSQSALNSKLYADAANAVLTPVANLSLQGGTIAFTPVPEPASLAIFGLGGLILLRRKRSHELAGA